jgi:hypothetical protein
VNNAPPHIQLTPEWLIWQSGTLVIKTEYFPVRNGTIVIADNAGRWPAVRIPFGEKYPAEIRWDRRFANGILAPSGDYLVTVSACNLYDLCSEKSATIKIPWYAPVLPTAAAPMEMVEVEQEPGLQTQQPAATMVPPAIELTVPDSEAPSEPQIDYETPASLFSFGVLIALMWVISSAALADKRPMAIRAIAKTISSHKHKGE